MSKKFPRTLYCKVLLLAFTHNLFLSFSRFTKIKLTGFPSLCLIKRMMHVLLKPNNDEVRALYQNHKSFYEGDCGLDLFCVEDHTVEAHDTSIINLGVRVSAFKKLEDGSTGKSVGWLMFPRSSMAKTPLRLSNSGTFNIFSVFSHTLFYYDDCINMCIRYINMCILWLSF